jgi:hypothetical protein
MKTTVNIVVKQSIGFYSFRAIAHPGKLGKRMLCGFGFPSKQSIHESVYAHFGAEVYINEAQRDPSHAY